MTTFAIDKDNHITAHTSATEAAGDAERFSTSAELAALAAQWPAQRLIDIWNSLPGVTPVHKFKDRPTAVTRIWKRLQAPGEAAQKPSPAAHQAHVASSRAKSAHKAQRGKPAPQARQKQEAARPGSKQAQILALLQKPKGATLAELMQITGWQAHSIRGFLSGTLGKKMGLPIASAKREDGQRVYSITP